jgi:hypothetical protein
MKVQIDSKSAMTVYRRILTKNRIVYLLVGKKTFKYKGGRSRIAYIGTSKRGAKRIASSAAERAEKMFSRWGSKEMQVYIVSCDAKPGLQSWKYLERALLAQFLSYYQQLPFCNIHGRKYKFDEKLQKMFKHRRIYKIVGRFDALS